MKFGIGQAVRRTEDLRFLRGTGRYTDDITLPRQTHAVFLRSPHAHARVRGIDTTAAAAVPGVLGIFTGADLKKAGLGDVPCVVPLENRDGSPMPIPPRPAIAVDTVRYVGDTVALVVAETLAAAKDAAELVDIDYEPLPAVVDMPAALEGGAPEIWDFAPGNVVFDWTLGDEAAADAAFQKAAKTVAIDIVNNRVAPTPIEPRGAIGEFSVADGRYTLYAATQGGHGIRELLAEKVFGIPASRIRVVTPDVGGGFGMKIFLYPEYVGVLFAARAIGRPVKWTGERADAFLSDTHGRDHITHAELALDGEGRFLSVKVTTKANLGAYLSHYGPFIPTLAGSSLLTGVYDIPAAFVEVKGVYTNTTPVDAYRGAGRPEAAYVVERLIGAAARAVGLSPEEIRRRNFIRPDQMPYRNALGTTYDSGEFARNMADAMRDADWAGFPERRAEAARRGCLRGIGLAYYIEVCGGAPAESAQIRIDGAGGVTVLLGNKTNGQGHETAYAQLAAALLGVEFEQVRVLQGDTDLFTHSGATGGSRALAVGGTAIEMAAQKVIEKGKQLAAHFMETAPADIEFSAGVFTVAGTDRRMTITEVAAKSHDEMVALPEGMAPGFDELARFVPPAATYSNGCHIAEVEIDRATGTAAVRQYTVVDDFGKVINPLLLEGQVHGGTAQGIGQALLEGCVYEPESGQLLTGSLMDYAVPRALDVPAISFGYNEVLTQANPLGVKGAGEAGAIGAPAAVTLAVIDALSPLGVEHVDMPATPEKIWRLIEAATG